MGSCVRCDVRRVFLRALSHPRLFLHTPGLLCEGENRATAPPPHTHTHSFLPWQMSGEGCKVRGGGGSGGAVSSP